MEPRHVWDQPGGICGVSIAINIVGFAGATSMFLFPFRPTGKLIGFFPTLIRLEYPSGRHADYQLALFTGFSTFSIVYYESGFAKTQEEMGEEGSVNRKDKVT